MSANRRCSTGWSGRSSRWSTTSPASPATAARAAARLGDLEFTVIDTAGLDEGAKGSLTARMQEQTETAIALADALMFVIDARAGLTPNDRAFADFARRANKPVVLVANKSEGRHGEAGAMESYALGLGDPDADFRRAWRGPERSLRRAARADAGAGRGGRGIRR